MKKYSDDSKPHEASLRPPAIVAGMERLPPPLRVLAYAYLALRRRWLVVRHRGRISCGEGVAVRGRLLIQQGTRVSLGPHVRIRGKVTVNGGGQVSVGAGTLLNGCWIVAKEQVQIGDRCLISDCGITDSDFHNLDPLTRHESPSASVTKAVSIDDNVWVGAHALVLKGSHIGTDSVVGAGGVVRGDIPAGVVVTGNPAVVVKSFSK